MADVEKLKLIQQVKDLQQQLLEAKQQNNLLRQQLLIEPEVALGPSQIESAVKKGWKEETQWKIEDRLKILSTLDLDPFVFEKEDHKLLILSFDMFDHLNLLETFKIPKSNLQNFLIYLQGSYRKVPFHNFFHSFNVTQSVFYFLTQCQVAQYFKPIELFALLISALCHDVDHPGLNNTFLCNARTSLGLLYNDFSVLEQHHCHKAFELLQKPECNILINLSDSEYRELRSLIISCILSTDLSTHGNYMAQLKNLQNPNWENFEDRKLLLCCLIKCADISNEIRPSAIGRKWALRVMTEFFAQSSLEKAKGLPVAPHMDPLKTNTASGQIGFINYLCLPLFSELVRIFPSMKVCCDQMISNRKNWEEISKQNNVEQTK